jgi:hypothetical protein
LAKSQIRDIEEEDFQWLWVCLIDEEEMAVPLISPGMATAAVASSWRYWLEEALYRIAAHLFSRKQWERATHAARAYLIHTRLLPLDRCQLKRIAVCHMLIHCLMQSFRSTNYRPPCLPAAYRPQTTAEQSAPAPLILPETIEQELSECLSLMEHLAVESVSYPRAGQPSGIIEAVYDDITIVYSLFNHTPPYGFMSSGGADNQQKETPIDGDGDAQDDDLPAANRSAWSRYIECCYRATGLTFRSRKQLRRLGLAAVLVEAVDEAVYAFKGYLERDKKDQQGDWFRREGISECLDLFRPDCGQAGDNETVEDVMVVLLAAARVYMTGFYVSYENH